MKLFALVLGGAILILGHVVYADDPKDARPVTPFPIRVQKFTKGNLEHLRLIVPAQKCRVVCNSRLVQVDILESFVVVHTTSPYRLSVRSYKTPDPQQEDARLEFKGNAVILLIREELEYELIVTYNEQDDD